MGRNAFHRLPVGVAYRLLTKVKRAHEKEHSGYDKNDILEKAGNEDPRRQDENKCYEAFDSKW